MSMPETSVNENSRAVPGQHDVGPPRQSGTTKPVAEAHRMQRVADFQFYSCVFSLDA